MKNLQFLILLLSCFLGLLSCSNDKSEKLLTKKWKTVFNLQQHFKSMSPQQKKFYDRLTEEGKKEALKEIEEKSARDYIEFKKDKTFVIFKEEEKIQEGTWELAYDGKGITLKNKKNETEKLEIREISPKKLLIFTEDEEIEFIPLEN